jgi:hypothetical protein
MKLELEVTLMVDWWNNEHHDEFEIWWSLLRNRWEKYRRNNLCDVELSPKQSIICLPLKTKE